MNRNIEANQKRLEEEKYKLQLERQKILDRTNQQVENHRIQMIEQQKSYDQKLKQADEDKRRLQLEQQKIIDESNQQLEAQRLSQLQQKKKYEEELKRIEEEKQRQIDEKRKIEEELRLQEEQARKQAELLQKYEEQRKAEEELKKQREELKKQQEEADRLERERQLEVERSIPKPVTLDEEVISHLYSLSDNSVKYVDSKDVKEVTYLYIPSWYIYKEQKYKIDKIASNIFKGSKIKEVTIADESVEVIEKSAFQRCNYLETVTISGKSGLKNIKENAFKDCNSLKAIFIPSTVVEIANYAFENCKGLEKVLIFEGVQSIGKRSFKGCSSLEKINIPSSVKTISQKAFCECTSLKYVNISDGVETIEESAFADCDSLKEIVIPTTVSEIEDEAFYGIEKVVYSGVATGSPWGAKDFIKSFDVADLPKITNDSVISDSKPVKDKFIECQDNLIKTSESKESQPVSFVKSKTVMNAVGKKEHKPIHNDCDDYDDDY